MLRRFNIHPTTPAARVALADYVQRQRHGSLKTLTEIERRISNQGLRGVGRDRRRCRRLRGSMRAAAAVAPAAANAPQFLVEMPPSPLRQKIAAAAAAAAAVPTSWDWLPTASGETDAGAWSLLPLPNRPQPLLARAWNSAWAKRRRFGQASEQASG